MPSGAGVARRRHTQGLRAPRAWAAGRLDVENVAGVFLREPDDVCMPVVTLGSDVLFDRQLLEGRRVGLVCNPASVDARFVHVVDRAEAAGVRVGAIFGPQHGFRSNLQENMIESDHGEDASRRVPIYSLYSDTREPTAAMLEGLEALVIDLQDVGTRIYTYIYTMANCLRACARWGVRTKSCSRNSTGAAGTTR